MGTVLDLPVIVADDLDGLLDRLRREHGVALAATVTDPDAEPIGRFDRPDRLASLLGSEAHGLDPARVGPLRPPADDPDAAGCRVAERRRSRRGSSCMS